MAIFTQIAKLKTSPKCPAIGPKEVFAQKCEGVLMRCKCFQGVSVTPLGGNDCIAVYGV